MRRRAWTRAGIPGPAASLALDMYLVGCVESDGSADQYELVYVGQLFCIKVCIEYKQKKNREEWVTSK